MHDHTGLLREGHDYMLNNKNYKYIRCNGTSYKHYGDACITDNHANYKRAHNHPISNDNVHKNYDAAFRDHREKYIVRAVADRQKAVNGVSLKFKDAKICISDVIKLENSGYRFKIKEPGSYNLRLMGKFEESVRGTMHVNITGHGDRNIVIHGNEFNNTFEITLRSDAYINFKFKLTNNKYLEYAKLYIN